MLTKIGRMALEITQDVADDAVRFYRGEGPRLAHLAEMSDDMVGRYFTPELSSAMNYVAEAADRKLLYVDVPKAKMAEYNLKATYETVLPREIADQAREYVHKSQVMAQNLVSSPSRPTSGRMGGVPTRSQTTARAHRRIGF